MCITDIVLSSENSLQIQFEQEISQKVNSQISKFVEFFEEFTKDIPEIFEIVPAYCSVTVYFDSENCRVSLLKKIAEEVLEKIDDSGISFSYEKKLICIPVCYEDEEFAPDLQTVASYSKLSEEEVIRIHSSTDYLIYMMGFLPGFPYLGGLDERLETPRLEVPRTKIPAGSVAIGGKQTGLYPVESPGGWQIIGRTPLNVFDLNRNPAFLYEAGDMIRFVPISRKEFDSFDEMAWFEKNYNSQNVQEDKKQTYACGSGIKLIDPGLNTTVQDSGIEGFQKYGIGQSGVMDEISFKLANHLCGNEKNAACLETTLNGPEIRFTLPCDFAITGAVFKDATLDNQPVLMNKKYHAEEGSVLKCGFASKGLRSYIAFSGGILVPKVFGSRSTNLKSKIGGYYGRKLSAGDELAIGWQLRMKNEELRIDFRTMGTGENNVITLDCVESSQFKLFSDDSINIFLNSEYTVTPESDRMGIRFTGKSLDCGKTDIISDAIPFGAVQITSSGLPVVMAADRQTTGGYAKIACVTKKSMCKLAQAIPGTKVRFNLIR